MEKRQLKNRTLRKLILTGSMLAEHSLQEMQADKKLATTWNELLDECRESGLLTSPIMDRNNQIKA